MKDKLTEIKIHQITNVNSIDKLLLFPIQNHNLTMGNEHDCLIAGCDGKKYDGSSFTCNRCLRPFFIECLMNRNEVKALINFLSAATTKTPMRLPNKVKLVLNSESIFEAVCLNCRAKGTFNDAIQSWKNETEATYVKSIEDSNIEIDRLNKQCDDLEKINANLNQKIYDMESDKHDENFTNNTEKFERRIIEQCDKRFDRLSTNITSMTTDFEARMKMECEKIRKTIAEQISNGNEVKRKKVVIDNGKEVNVPNNKSVNESKSNRVPKNNVLKPPEGLNKSNSDPKNGIYMIHVSKFHVGTTENDIENFIIENTEIKNGESFKVTKIINYKDENKDKYVSFKINTLKYENYVKIMNDELWLPNFRAREYIQVERNLNNNSTRHGRNNVYTTPNRKRINRQDMRTTPISKGNMMRRDYRGPNNNLIFNEHLQNTSGREVNRQNRNQSAQNPQYIFPNVYPNAPNGFIHHASNQQNFPIYGHQNPNFWSQTQPPNQIFIPRQPAQTNQIPQQTVQR